MKTSLEPQRLDNLPLHQGIFRGGLELMPNNRGYGLTENSNRAGAALVRALLTEGKPSSLSKTDVAALLRRLSPRISTLYQSWRPVGPAPEPPKPWQDPITGQPLANPFAEPQDRLGQTLLLQRAPALANHFKAMLQDPYGTVAALDDEKQRRDALLKLSYTAQDHEANIFRSDPMEVAEELAHFLETQPPHVVSTWRWEAKSPVVLPWQHGSENRTDQGFLARSLDEKPFMGVGGQLIWTAAKIDSELVRALEKQAREEAEAAMAHAKELAAATSR
jgi:hypothetical protein